MKSLRIAILLITFLWILQAPAQTPVELANAQLEAYNNRDIEAFLIPYSDSVEVYDENMELLYRGKETMRERYGKFFYNTPELNCNLLNRIALGNTVVEHEEVTVDEGNMIYAIVMYKIADNKIQKVYFVDRELP